MNFFLRPKTGTRYLPACIICIVAILWPVFLSAQLGRIEDGEAAIKKGFFKTHFADLFKDFSEIGDPFALTGGVGLNLRSYEAINGQDRQDPFFYSFHANLNVRIHQLHLPLSILITAKNRSSSLPNFRELGNAFSREDAYRQRFLRMGISPQYKWIKLHLGHRSMNFSKFTLANLNFLGAGAELTPGKWKVATMYGRLAEARPINLALNRPNLPVFRRTGWGTSLGYGAEGSAVSLILFGARDDLNTVTIPADSPRQVAPAENFVVGLKAEQVLFDRLWFKLDYGLSALSPNRLDERATDRSYPGFLFKERVTTDINSALDASLDYEGKSFTGGVQLRRIDPNYQSFGAYFFNNDLLDLLGNLSFGVLKGAAKLQLSAGVQYNNLDLRLPTTNQRFVYNAAFSYAKNSFSANANYTNNTTDVGFVLNQELDSLNAVLIMENAGVSASYVWVAKSGSQHVFTFGANLQQVSDDIETPSTSLASQMLVGLLNYSVRLPSQWRFNSRLNFNRNELAGLEIRRLGAGFGINKSLLKGKMNLGIAVNHFWNSNEIATNTRNLQGNFRWKFQISKMLQTSLQYGLLQTNSAVMEPFTELTGMLGLQYNFNYRRPAVRETQR